MAKAPNPDLAFPAVTEACPQLRTKLGALHLFELVTLHLRTDWEKFSSSGTKAVRRWYKLQWKQSVNHVLQKICDGLTKSIQDHIPATTKRLSDKSERWMYLPSPPSPHTNIIH